MVERELRADDTHSWNIAEELTNIGKTDVVRVSSEEISFGK